MIRVSSLLSGGLDLLYPRSCPGCGAPSGSATGHVCWDCLAGLDLIKDPFCRLCGDPADGLIEHEYMCTSCCDRRPYFDQARSAVRYRKLMRHFLHVFKYEDFTGLSSDFAMLLLASARTHYADAQFDAVTFVPLYPKRQRERTYNQSGLLAGKLARHLRLPLFSNCLRRVRSTRTQTNLNAAQRRENVRGAFEVSRADWVAGRRLLLVDDVMTTGATVNECSRLLKKANAAEVRVLSVARG